MGIVKAFTRKLDVVVSSVKIAFRGVLTGLDSGLKTETVLARFASLSSFLNDTRFRSLVSLSLSRL
jgi:hypothetical protein